MEDRNLRIGLLWHSFRSDNLGVGALAVANLMIVLAAAARAGRRAQCVSIGFGGPLDYVPKHAPVEEHLIPSSKELRPGSRLWRVIRSCDVVLDIGAGDSWADIYGGKRFLWQWMSKEMALIQRRPLVLSPQTIGPFDRALPRTLARFTMRRARKVFTRDNESFAFARRLDARIEAVETVDVAFRLPYEPRRKNPSRLQFGFNVSGLLYAGGYTRKGQFGSRDAYRALVDGVVERLLARGDIDIVLVPHVVPGDGSVEDDVAVSRRLVERYPGVTMAPAFASPMEAKGFISGLDVLAGSRMHATIAAASSGVAVVPLAYSRKFRGVFQSIDYPIVGDCTTTSPEELISLTLSAVDRRAELAAAAAAGSARTIQSLAVYEDYLAQLFADVAT